MGFKKETHKRLMNKGPMTLCLNKKCNRTG